LLPKISNGGKNEKTFSRDFQIWTFQNVQISNLREKFCRKIAISATFLHTSRGKNKKTKKNSLQAKIFLFKKNNLGVFFVIHK
jgi:hypothetical protein